MSIIQADTIHQQFLYKLRFYPWTDLNTHPEIRKQFWDPQHWPKHVLVRYTWYATFLDHFQLCLTSLNKINKIVDTVESRYLAKRHINVMHAGRSSQRLMFPLDFMSSLAQVNPFFWFLLIDKTGNKFIHLMYYNLMLWTCDQLSHSLSYSPFTSYNLHERSWQGRWRSCPSQVQVYIFLSWT